MTAVEFIWKIFYECEDLHGFKAQSFNQNKLFNHAKKLEKKQMFISDEEIEKASYEQATFAPSFIAGAKWYREQLIKNNK